MTPDQKKEHPIPYIYSLMPVILHLQVTGFISPCTNLMNILQKFLCPVPHTHLETTLARWTPELM